MMAKPKMIFGLHQFMSFTVITWNPESKLYVPTEESFPVPLKYIDVTRTSTSLDVMLEKSIEDYWNVDGDRDFSDTGWIHMVLGEIYKKSDDLKTGQCMAGYVETYVWCIEMQREAEVGNRETKARKRQEVRGIFFIDPDEDEFKRTMKMFVESWKFRCQ